MTKGNGSSRKPIVGVHAVFVVPYPISTGKDFIYIREPKSKLYRLPYIHVESAEGLPKSGTEVTMRGLDVRVRVGQPIGVYTFKADSTDLVTFAFAAKCLDSLLKVADASIIGNVRQFSLDSLDDICDFYGLNYSIAPVKDSFSKLSIPDNRIVRFC